MRVLNAGHSIRVPHIDKFMPLSACWGANPGQEWKKSILPNNPAKPHQSARAER
jgi:hypothetical protein